MRITCLVNYVLPRWGTWATGHESWHVRGVVLVFKCCRGNVFERGSRHLGSREVGASEVAAVVHHSALGTRTRVG